MSSTLEIALAYLAQYTTRYIFPIKANAKFPPLIHDNLNKASNDPEQIIKWHERWPGCNWGVALAKSNLICADLDMKDDGPATFALLAILHGWPETEQTLTPSGGVHHLYAGQHIFALGKNGFGPGVDSPNYIIMPGCVTPQGAYTALQSPPIADAPDWFKDVLGKKQRETATTQTPLVDLDQAENVAMAVDYLIHHAPASIEGQGGEKTLFDVAARLKDMGISYDTAVDLLGEHYNRPWDIDREQGKGYCEPVWAIGDCDDSDSLPKKVGNAYTYAVATQPGAATAEASLAEDIERFKADPPDPLTPAEKKAEKEAQKKNRKTADDAKTRSALCERWVYIANTGSFYGRTPGRNGELPVRNVKLFDNDFASLKPARVSTISKWVFETNAMRKFENVGYMPTNNYIEGDTDIADREAYNTYRPSRFVPEQSDTTLWNKHLAYLFPDQESRDLVLNWCAWVLQNLSEKPMHALLIAGKVQGTGKTLIARVMEQLIGKHNSQPIGEAELTSSFNEWELRGKLCWVEELRTIDKKHVAEKLHPKITQARAKINEKNVKRFTADSFAAFLFMTNHDAAVPLDQTDRRYAVVRTHADPHPDGKAYYTPLYALLRDKAALQAIMYELLNRDLKGYSGLDRAPFTEAKRDMERAGWSDLECFLVDRAEGWPLGGRITSIDDVLELIRMEAPQLMRTPRLYNTVGSVLRDRFQGVQVGQQRIATGRKSLWVLNGSGLSKMNVSYGAIYDADRKKARAGLKSDAAADFNDDEEQTNEE